MSKYIVVHLVTKDLWPEHSFGKLVMWPCIAHKSLSNVSYIYRAHKTSVHSRHDRLQRSLQSMLGSSRSHVPEALPIAQHTHARVPPAALPHQRPSQAAFHCPQAGDAVHIREAIISCPPTVMNASVAHHLRGRAARLVGKSGHRSYTAMRRQVGDTPPMRSPHRRRSRRRVEEKPS